MKKKILFEITFFQKNLLDFSTPPTIVSPEPEISCGIQEKSKVLGGDNATLGKEGSRMEGTLDFDSFDIGANFSP